MKLIRRFNRFLIELVGKHPFRLALAGNTL
jgi:hypothetical protein